MSYAQGDAIKITFIKLPVFFFTNFIKFPIEPHISWPSSLFLLFYWWTLMVVNSWSNSNF